LQLGFVETSAAKNGRVFVVGGDIFGPDPEHQKRLHVRTLRDRGQTLPKLRASASREQL
jgi:hypothetical protein